jgi:hypothetical protein
MRRAIRSDFIVCFLPEDRSGWIGSRGSRERRAG